MGTEHGPGKKGKKAEQARRLHDVLNPKTGHPLGRKVTKTFELFLVPFGSLVHSAQQIPIPSKEE